MRFVHLAPEAHARGIERGGIAGRPTTVPTEADPIELRDAVYAMPVVADYGTTFQWTREMRRVHGTRMVAVHFRVPDDETVHVGRFGQPHRVVNASAAAPWVEANPRGAEVIVARRIEAREVVAVRAIDQRVGWAESPETDGRVACVCPACLGRGDPKFMRRIRAAAERAHDAVRGATNDDELARALGSFEMPLERAPGRFDTSVLYRYVAHPSARVRRSVTWLLGYLREDPRSYAALLGMLGDADPEVRDGAVESLTRIAKLETIAKATLDLPDAVALALVSTFDVMRCSDDFAAALDLLASRDDASIRVAVRERASEASRDTDDARLRARLERLAAPDPTGVVPT